MIARTAISAWLTSFMESGAFRKWILERVVRDPDKILRKVLGKEITIVWIVNNIILFITDVMYVDIVIENMAAEHFIAPIIAMAWNVLNTPATVVFFLLAKKKAATSIGLPIGAVLCFIFGFILLGIWQVKIGM